MSRIRGYVVGGLGRGAAFTGLPWAREQFLDKLGIEAHPGTLNIHLADERSHGNWQALAQSPPCSIDAPDKDSCDAPAYPVFINDRVAGAVVRPLVDGYAAGQLEIIASLNLRRFLELRDGALLDAVVTGDDVTRRKPDPEGLHQCLDRLGLAPRDAVYVGDTSIDMQACRSAGMTPVAVLSGAGNAASLCAAGAHRTVRDHRGLSDLFEHGQPAAPA